MTQVKSGQFYLSSANSQRVSSRHFTGREGVVLLSVIVFSETQQIPPRESKHGKSGKNFFFFQEAETLSRTRLKVGIHLTLYDTCAYCRINRASRQKPLKSHLCSMLNKHTDTDRTFCPYSAFIWSVYPHIEIQSTQWSSTTGNHGGSVDVTGR